jgi:hypothetical protein
VVYDLHDTGIHDCATAHNTHMIRVISRYHPHPVASSLS